MAPSASALANIGLIDLNKDRQILTRLQALQIRRTFPFLALPPELRNMIYELCIDFTSVEKYFDRYYKHIKNKEEKKKFKRRSCNRSTPPVFLINRQIFNEASSLINKQGILFHHGIFNLGKVDKVVSKNVLRQVSSITINVSGHPITQKNILRESWHGYMELMTELSLVLSKGHRLKNLTIDLEDPKLDIHITECWDAGDEDAGGYKCDFREHMQAAFKCLRSIRGVGNVALKGFPACVAPGLKARMESKPIHFLDLPGEIRNMIYKHAANPSDISAQLNNHMLSWTDRDTPMPAYPAKTTPTIFLLNKRITAEALHVVRSRPLTITFSITHELQKQPQVPLITGFITEKSLQQIEHLRFHLEKWEWVYSIESLITTLREQHKLKSFHLYIRDALKAKFMRGAGRYYPDKALHESLVGLKGVRGVERVLIEGDLPEVYARPLGEIMRSSKLATVLPKLMSVVATGALVDVEAVTTHTV